MRKSCYLSLALLLMTSGWVSAFLLNSRLDHSQALWLVPALIIGCGIGLCLKYNSGRKTALLLAATAALGLAIVNSFFPASRVSLDLISGRAGADRGIILGVAEELRKPPFDLPLHLVSPLDLEVVLQARLPAGIEDFCFSPSGELYASLPSLGAVYRLPLTPPGTTPAKLFRHSLDNPTGLACDELNLLIAESSRVKAHPYADNSARILIEDLPDDGSLRHRLWIASQGLLVSVDSRCDACEENNPLRGTVQRLDPAGRLSAFARGLRAIGAITSHGGADELWASENSRLYPPPGAGDELNRLKEGADYGWPFCAGGEEAGPACDGKQKPALVLRNRANPAGLTSAARLDLPAAYAEGLLLMLQGDMQVKIRPALVQVPMVNGRPGSPRAFLGGWDGRSQLPGAIRSGPDRALYIADRVNGAIYRAKWRGGR